MAANVREGGVLRGNFRVVKRGQNYGISYLPR